MSRWRKGLLGLGGLVGVAAVVFFGFVPQYVESTRNTTWEPGPWTFEGDVRARHDGLLVADLHTDSLLWDRDLRRSWILLGDPTLRMGAGNRIPK